ncbi:MAG: hypothetical protein JWN40_1953 [Phycisphaerales bacterium]|nr:hypothetical protein [Phycisphaerales bacterium]
MRLPSNPLQPSKNALAFPELDRAMRALVKVPKSEIDAARRKELKRKPVASKRKRK